MNDHRFTLRERFKQFMHDISTEPSYIECGKKLLLEIRATGRDIADTDDRDLYVGMARDIGDRLLELTGEYLPVRLEPLGIRRDSATSETRDQGVLTALPIDIIPDIAPLPPGSRMPLFPNPLFVGRVEDLKMLAQTLTQSDTTTISQIAAVTGPGGIGKTNLATEFVHRYGQFFGGGVFWLNFADPAGISSEIVACGGVAAMNLPNFSSISQDEQVRRVLQEWQKPIRRLLVFDNCEDEVLLAQWHSKIGGCRVLVTSRRVEWDAALGVVALHLTVLPRAESIALLHKFLPDLSIDDRIFDAIAAELGDLPLALHLAGNFLARYRHVITPATYLAQLRSPTLLQHRSLQFGGISPTGHQQNIVRTIALSYEQLDPVNPADVLAIRVLARAAHFAPGAPIPRELLLATLGQMEDSPSIKFQIEDALIRLVDLGLLERGDGETLRLHRLVAMFVHGEGDDEEAQAAVELALINAAYQINGAGFPAAMQPIRLHLHHATDAAMSRVDEFAATLCRNLGYHLQVIGDYAGAQPYLERSQAIDEAIYGPDRPDTATSLNNLAGLLQAMGDYAAARPLYERALAIREQVLGPQHLTTANSLNSLALLLQDQGDYTRAKPLYERALAIYEHVLGPQHPTTATSLNNLAGLLQSQGDYAAARPLYERALAIREQALGPQHPDTAQSLNNLAALLHGQGDYAAAQPLYERALTIWEQTLGPDHPGMERTLNNLAALLAAQGEYAKAQLLCERTLTICERVLGTGHPDTARALNNLGSLLHLQREYAKARDYLERALAIREVALGDAHPDTARALANLARSARDAGDTHRARTLYERALGISERALGSQHAETINRRDALSSIAEE